MSFRFLLAALLGQAKIVQLTLRLPRFWAFHSGLSSRKTTPVFRNDRVYNILGGPNQWEIVQSLEEAQAAQTVQHHIDGSRAILLCAVRLHSPKRFLCLFRGQSHCAQHLVPLERNDEEPAPAIQPACARGEGGSEPSGAVEKDDGAVVRDSTVFAHVSPGWEIHIADSLHDNGG